MTLKPTTLMLLGFSGIVVYLLVTSAKKAPSTTTGAVLPAAGGYNPASYTPTTTGTGTASTAPSASQAAEQAQYAQQQTSSAAGANDFFNALGSDTPLPGGGN